MRFIVPFGFLPFQGRTLHTALVNKEKLEPEVWQDIAWQLARGLLLIHERHVLLNDLKVSRTGTGLVERLQRRRKSGWSWFSRAVTTTNKVGLELV